VSHGISFKLERNLDVDVFTAAEAYVPLQCNLQTTGEMQTVTLRASLEKHPTWPATKLLTKKLVYVIKLLPT